MEFLTLKEYLEMDIPDIEFYETGSYCFDNIVGGILKSGITVVAGGTGQGKSMVGLHLASLLSKENKVLYLSIENAIQIDMKRFRKTLEIYNVNEENITYINAILYDESYSEILKTCLEKVKTGEYDIFVIDGADLMFKEDGEGAKMYQEGQNFMKSLHKTLSDTSSSCILTWQLNRGGITKEIDEIDTSDIATSMGIVKFASQVYVVKRYIKNEDKKETKKNKDNWKLRLIKTRTEANWEHSTIDILDNKNNINLTFYDESCAFVDDLKNYIDNKEED